MKSEFLFLILFEHRKRRSDCWLRICFRKFVRQTNLQRSFLYSDSTSHEVGVRKLFAVRYALKNVNCVYRFLRLNDHAFDSNHVRPWQRWLVRTLFVREHVMNSSRADVRSGGGFSSYRCALHK